MMLKAGTGPVHLTLSERNIQQLQETSIISKLIPHVGYVIVEVEPNDVHYERQQASVEAD